MYKDFLLALRKKPNGIDDMPDRAQDVLKYFRINNMASGIPIVDILTKMEFKVYQSNLEPEGMSAYIAVDPGFESVFKSNKIACVHIKDDVELKKYALAYELGHYLFDYNENESLHYYDTYFSRNSNNTMEEKRANKFAINLLMPEKIFRKRFKACKKLQNKEDIIHILEQQFMVPSFAVRERLQELGMLGTDYMEK